MQSFFVICFMVLATGLSQQALACDCISQPDVTSALQRSAIVFLGVAKSEPRATQPIPEDKPESYRELEFKVISGFKGVEVDWQKVFLANNNCAYPFQKGETYLVYGTAHRRTGRLTVNICTRTALLRHAIADLAQLPATFAPKAQPPLRAEWE